MLEIRNPVWLLILAFIVLISDLGSWGLTETSEGRYAEIGREMYRSGDFLHPTDLGIRHYHKPPLTYYLTSLGYALFGVNEFGARFFLAVAFSLQLLLLWKIGLLLFHDRKMALSGAVIYFSVPLALLSGRVLTTDAFLNTCALGAVYFFLQYRHSGKTRNLYAFYLALGLGFLTKGPAVLIPAGAFLLFWKLFKRERISFSLHSVLAGLFCLLLSGSWYLLVSLDNPAFLGYFLGDQILDRAFSASGLHRAKPVWYYVLLAPLLGFPWLPFAFASLLGKKRPARGREPTPRILAFTALSILAFYSLISSKLIFYILPMFPFVALLAGYSLFRMPPAGLKVLGWSLAVLTGLVTLGLGVLPWLPDLAVSGVGALAFVLVSGLAMAWLFRKFASDLRNRILGFSVLLGMQILFGYALFASGNPYKVHTYRELATKIGQIDPARQRPVLIYNFWAPSIAFYRDRPVITIRADDRRIEPELQFEQDSTYKSQLIDTGQPGEKARLYGIIGREKPIVVFLMNDSVPQTLQKLLAGDHTLELYHKYQIYY